MYSKDRERVCLLGSWSAADMPTSQSWRVEHYESSQSTAHQKHNDRQPDLHDSPAMLPRFSAFLHDIHLALRFSHSWSCGTEHWSVGGEGRVRAELCMNARERREPQVEHQSSCFRLKNIDLCVCRGGVATE